MPRCRPAFLLAIASALAASSARADENLFGYSYGSETLPKGAWEFYNWLTWRTSKGKGDYDALDFRQELEYGVTDRFQVSMYLNERYHNIEGAAPLEEVDGVLEPEYPDRHHFGFQGVQAAFKYNFLNPYENPVGFALYLEPGWSRIFKIGGQPQNELSLELRIMLQKNFLDDQLITVLNINPEVEYRKLKSESGGWENEFALEFTGGAAYRIAPNWYAGLEARYHSEYPNFTHGFDREHWAVFVGPVIHYGAERWWWTLTLLPQVYGKPHDNERSGTLHLGEHEKFELRLKVGYNF
jgi:hypothetical protein